MVAFGEPVKVLPFFINPRQGTYNNELHSTIAFNFDFVDCIVGNRFDACSDC